MAYSVVDERYNLTYSLTPELVQTLNYLIDLMMHLKLNRNEIMTVIWLSISSTICVGVFQMVVGSG